MKKIEDYMRAKDIVRIYGISLSTVKNWQKTGKLKVLHVSSKKILFLKKEVEALFIKENILKHYMQAKDIVKKYKIALSTIRRWQKIGKLRSTKVSSNQTLFIKEEVEGIFNPIVKKMRFLNNKTKIKYLTKEFSDKQEKKDAEEKQEKKDEKNKKKAENAQDKKMQKTKKTNSLLNIYIIS